MNVGVANLYADPSFTSPVVSQAILGESLETLEKQDKWYRVRQWDGYISWIYSLFIVDFPEIWEPNFQYRLRSGWVYSEPGMGEKTQRQITIGAELPGEFVEEHWLKVTMPDESHGYVYDRKIPEPEVLTDRLLFTAERFLGVSYLWGGKTPMGFDCSGFVQTVYWLNGVRLPRDSHEQADHGTNLQNRDRVKKGDLFFFASGDIIDHVGIALDQDRFIHCSGMVKWSSLDPDCPEYDERLDKIYVAANRVIKP